MKLKPLKKLYIPHFGKTYYLNKRTHKILSRILKEDIKERETN